MDLFRSLRAVADASSEGGSQIDWAAVEAATTAGTDPGDLPYTKATRQAYASDVGEARDRIRAATGLDFDVPRTVEIQNRHHWTSANVETFARVFGPIERRAPPALGPVRVLNTGGMALVLGFLARHVLGQYDPLLLADGGEDHALYFVHPNVVRTAEGLGVSEARFRRWIAAHEVAHAAEFGAAPWLAGHLEDRLEASIDGMGAGGLDRTALSELDTAMTAVEGYAELLMDRALDGEFDDIRRRVEERRQGGSPVERLARRLLGLGVKRRQYERGRRFFEVVADARGLTGASRVWAEPSTLPTRAELDDPTRWLARVG